MCPLVTLLILLLLLVLLLLPLVVLLVLASELLVGCDVTASENKLVISDVTNDDLIDDDVESVIRDIDDVDILSATVAEVTPSDVMFGSRDVTTGVDMLTGDVIEDVDIRLLLLLLFTVDVDFVMVTSLLRDVINCIETSLTD